MRMFTVYWWTCFGHMSCGQLRGASGRSAPATESPVTISHSLELCPGGQPILASRQRWQHKARCATREQRSVYEAGSCALTNAVLDCEAKAGREGDGARLIVSTGCNIRTTQSRARPVYRTAAPGCSCRGVVRLAQPASQADQLSLAAGALQGCLTSPALVYPDKSGTGHPHYCSKRCWPISTGPARV